MGTRKRVPMSFSQADRFEQHVNNQLSKSLGAIPVLFPILRRLGVAQTIHRHCAGGEEVSHSTTVEILTLNVFDKLKGTHLSEL